MAKLLLVIDMQNDFIDGALGTPEAVKIIPAVEERVKKRQNEGWDVWFTMDTHTEDKYMGSKEGQWLPVPHCTDICVISNAMIIKAALPESDISVVKDCCAGVTPESHENALKAMEKCHIKIV